ncbi:hypothetical protein ACO0M4_32505 [Streptomyces sp. RGM 3693]|uniref:hypothetical protein n=1 Tax=Streptomyces sp. RGM 3693 TaxID=3413284 RepID=UPI003D2C42CD
MDTIGLLLVVLVTAASVQDRDGARPSLEFLRELYERITLVCGATATTPASSLTGPGRNPSSRWRQSSAATTPRASSCSLAPSC